MNDITTRQNEDHFIELLKAQRVAYSQCKRYQIFDVVSIAIAVSFPLATILFPTSNKMITAFGVLWTIAYLIAEGFRRNKSTQGAVIQEQFDTELYNMDWNKFKSKNKIAIDTIHHLARKYKKDDLKNWYSNKISDNLPPEVAVILCQRINISWEISQRKKYVKWLITAASIYYFVYIIVGFTTNISFFDLLVLLSPSLSFLIYIVQNGLSLNKHVKSKSETKSLVDQEINNYRKSKTLPTPDTLRKIQDVIFTERTVPEKVPDWFYRLNKDFNENFIDELIVKIQKNF